MLTAPYLLKGSFFYSKSLTFEDMSLKESQIVELLEEKLFAFSCTGFTMDSHPDALTFSCTMPALLPLRFFEKLADSLLQVVDSDTVGRLLFVANKLDSIHVATITYEEVKLDQLDLSIPLSHNKHLPDPLPISQKVKSIKKKLDDTHFFR